MTAHCHNRVDPKLSVRAKLGRKQNLQLEKKNLTWSSSRTECRNRLLSAEGELPNSRTVLAMGDPGSSLNVKVTRVSTPTPPPRLETDRNSLWHLCFCVLTITVVGKSSPKLTWLRSWCELSILPFWDRGPSLRSLVFCTLFACTHNEPIWTHLVLQNRWALQTFGFIGSSEKELKEDARAHLPLTWYSWAVKKARSLSPRFLLRRKTDFKTHWRLQCPWLLLPVGDLV